jgi:hypothetical protein
LEKKKKKKRRKKMKLIIIIILLIFFQIKKFHFHNSNLYRHENRTFVEAEKMLIKSLFKEYDKNSRPADTVQVKFSLYLNQIITIIEQEQVLVVNVFLDHEWIDDRLKWDSAIHSNITLLRINNEILWT